MYNSSLLNVTGRLEFEQTCLYCDTGYAQATLTQRTESNNIKCLQGTVRLGVALPHPEGGEVEVLTDKTNPSRDLAPLTVHRGLLKIEAVLGMATSMEAHGEQGGDK